VNYKEAWEAHKRRQHIIPPREQDFRHGWNACLQVAREIALEGTDDAREAANAKDTIEVEVQT
jgi:hypothetical protein